MSLTVTETDEGDFVIEAKPEFAPLMRLEVRNERRLSNQFLGKRRMYSRVRTKSGWWVIDPIRNWDFGRYTSQEKALAKALKRANWFIEAYSVDRHVKRQEKAA